MALRFSSRTTTGASVGRPSVRCASVHFPTPVITPARAPATEVLSPMNYSSVPKPFLIVQAPYDLLAMDDSGLVMMERGNDPEIRQANTRDQIGGTVTDIQDAVDDKLKTQKGTLGILDAITNAINGISQKT